MPSSFATSPFSTRSSKKARSSARSFSKRLEAVLEQLLGQRRVVREIGERDLRLDHPELGKMPAGVGVLRPERRPEGVDLGEREAVRLDIELARHRQERLAAEEILGEIDLALRRARQVGEVERRDPEQLPRPFGVGRRDDRRVDPERSRCSSKNRWIACASVWRTRVAAPITLVRGRKCATSRRNSMVCGFGWIG